VAAGKLSFGETLSESFGFFFANIRLFFHIVTIPWIMSLAIRIVGNLLAVESAVAALVEKAVDVLPTVMFVVAWQRIVLLGPHRLDRLPGTGWSARESAYLGHLLKVAGMTFLLMAVFMITIWPVDPAALRAGPEIDPEIARRYALAGPLAFGFIVSLLLALRVSYGLAATAVDVPFSPRLSWIHSRGTVWPIVAALFFVYFGGAFVTAVAHMFVLGLMRGVFGAREAAYLVAWTTTVLVSYGVIAVTATVQAVIFRRLLGWREGAGLPALTPS
jgi:hypothetical protein